MATFLKTDSELRQTLGVVVWLVWLGFVFGLIAGPPNAPSRPNTATGQVYSLERHGTVYVTRAAHVQARLGMLLLLATIGLGVLAAVAVAAWQGRISIRGYGTVYGTRDPPFFWGTLLVLTVLGITALVVGVFQWGTR